MANWLCPLLAQHDGLLDLHSFQADGQPFVMVGPLDNQGSIEPFGQAAQEEALVQVPGVNRAVDGWLDTYAGGVARRGESGGGLMRRVPVARWVARDPSEAARERPV